MARVLALSAVRRIAAAEEELDLTGYLDARTAARQDILDALPAMSLAEIRSVAIWCQHYVTYGGLRRATCVDVVTDRSEARRRGRM